MTRSDLKNLILECIDEKMDDITQKVIDKVVKINNFNIQLNKEGLIDIVKDIRKDVDHIGRHLKLSLPSDDLPF